MTIRMIEAPERRTRRRLSIAEGLAEVERRLYERIPADIGYVPHQSFCRPETEERLFGKQAEEIETPAWYPLWERPEDAPDTSAKRVRPTAEQEAAGFLRYNYACFRVSRLVEAQHRQATLVRAKEIVLWYGRAMKLRAYLVRAYMALVIAMAKRTSIRNVEFAEMIGEGNLALLRSVEKFDVARGFRFSTYACRSILKSFSRLARKADRYRKLFPTGYDPDLDPRDHDVMSDEMQRRSRIESVRELLAENRARLAPLERTILTERFALGSGGKKKSLAAVGKIVGLTCERVRQIQNAALAKIRSTLEEEAFVA